MRARLLLGFAVVLALGCGSRKFAPVSGKVTLNGTRLADATVSFQPIAEKGIQAGPGSTGKTNEKGEFILKASTGENGAWVGKHRVMISLLNSQIGDRDERPPRGGWPLEDKVPAKYGPGGKEELTFVVTSGGTDKADFDLKSP